MARPKKTRSDFSKIKMVRPDEMSDILDVSTGTLANWRSLGEGPPFVRISSRCIRYPLMAAMEWARGQR